jgi:hypothetical protein
MDMNALTGKPRSSFIVHRSSFIVKEVSAGTECEKTVRLFSGSVPVPDDPGNKYRHGQPDPAVSRF